LEKVAGGEGSGVFGVDGAKFLLSDYAIGVGVGARENFGRDLFRRPREAWGNVAMWVCWMRGSLCFTRFDCGALRGFGFLRAVLAEGSDVHGVNSA